MAAREPALTRAVTDDTPPPGAPVPVENRPGHHPEHEQDRPEDPGPWRARPGRFRFRFEPATVVLGAPFGITPWTTWLDVGDGDLSVRYGPWSLQTPLRNVVAAERTGPYHLVKIAGPPRLSLRDRGLSMATSSEGGLCIAFERPVRCLDPLGLLRHPALTVTVEEPERLRRALAGVTGTGAARQEGASGD